MSKAAELTREELIQKLGDALENEHARDMLDWGINGERFAKVLLSELQALGLAIVPRKLTLEMSHEAIKQAGELKRSGAPTTAIVDTVWALALSASPFVGN